jgi:hypothetical protein
LRTSAIDTPAGAGRGQPISPLVTNPAVPATTLEKHLQELSDELAKNR